MDFLLSINLLLKWLVIFIFGIINYLNFILIFKIFVREKWDAIAYFLVGWGISLYLIVHLLYYLLLLIKGFSHEFYIIILVGVIGFNGVFLCWKYSFYQVRNVIEELKSQFIDLLNFWGIRSYWMKFLFFVVVIVFIAGWLFYLNRKSISEHDTLEYAVCGKNFCIERTIEYKRVPYNDRTGFYYVGLHGFSFPLIYALECMSNDLMNSEDLFFRSINSISGMLIFILIFLSISRHTSKFYSILFAMGYWLIYSVFETEMKYHIDNFRIMLLVFNLFFILKNMSSIFDMRKSFVLGVLMGGMSNAHSLGFLLSFIIMISLILSVQKGSFLLKIKRIVFIFLVSILFGGVHYLLDIFLGTGWLFQSIKFY
ncbi:MAG: hypothetical protein KatS3mg027_0273 [Bacteroidia bacterium]|nr:MAG: hypothetical protein KatS3mg027_0273 [Bacteroidia bacterium]